MTAPLSSAAGGMRYSGTGTGGELAKLVAGLVSGRRQQEEATRKAALEAAMQVLREREADQMDRGLDMRAAEGAQRGIDTAENQNIEYEKLNAERNDKNADNNRVVQEGIANRKNALDVAKIGATSRENVADTRANTPGRGLIVTQGKDGEILIVDKEAHTVRPTSTTGGAVPTNAEGTPVGSGARPGQGERDAASMYTAFKVTSATLAENMKKVEFQAPNVGTQLLLDGSKASGLGPVSSVARSLSNTVLSSTNPDYQLVQNSLDATGSMFIKLMTGAQMSEPEALRLFNVIGPKAGDTSETVAQKMKQLNDIVQAQYLKVGRAGALLDAASAAPPPPSGGKKYVLPDGTVVE